MVVYGGAGPLHASAIAREIGIRNVLIPYAPGYFSAYGMLFSDLRYDYVRSVFRRLDGMSFEEIEAAYKTMEDEGRAALAASGIQADGVVRAKIANSQETLTVGQIRLAGFSNAEQLAKTSDGLYRATRLSGDPVYAEPGQGGQGTLLQAHVEMSNVNMIEEMTGLVLAQRAALAT